MRYKISYLKPFFFFFLFVPVQIFSQGLGVTPYTLDFRVAPGEVQTKSIMISNLTDKKMIFEAYLGDWIRDTVGGHQYYKPDTLSQSCASWVEFDKKFIEVQPGTNEELIVRVKGPMDPAMFKQMRWSMLFLQNAPEQEQGDRLDRQVKTEIRELIRMGIHIYQTPPTLTRTSAKVIALKPVEGENNSYNLYMENTGETMVHSKAHLELTDVATGKEYKLEKIEFPVFPGGKRIVKFEIPSSIPNGKYSALAILDIGEDSPLEAIEKVIEVKQ